MALVTIPSIPANGYTLKLLRSDRALEFMGGNQAIVQSPFALWTAQVSLRPLKQDAARPWLAALTQLSKLSNTFEFRPVAWSPNTYGGAQPLVQGANQLGLTLTCDGVTPNTTIAQQADFIEVNGEFKRLNADAVSNGTGVVTFEFEPALRNSPADNAPVEVVDPKVIMRLTKPIHEESVNLSGFTDLEFDAIEYFAS